MKKDRLTLEFSKEKKIEKKQIENLRSKIKLPLEFAADGTFKVFVGLSMVDQKRSLFVKNLLLSL